MPGDYAETICSEKPEYPKSLDETEKILLRKRRRLQKSDPLKHLVGIGLSGGGIRSATFCLGIFQGLARKKLLSKIDYLSSVSGGGYFAAFYGRLFTRESVRNVSDIEDVLAVRAANQETTGSSTDDFPKKKVFRWLRENGRYLAPSGSGDVLLGSAAMLRNFIAVHFVLWTFILMIFLFAQLLRGGLEVVCQVGETHQCWWWPALQNFLVEHLPAGKGLIWWSPYMVLVGVVFLVLVIPPAWCYWLVEKPNRRTAGRWIPPFWGWFVAILLALIGMTADWVLHWLSELRLIPAIELQPALFWVSLILSAVSGETMIWGLLSGYVPRFRAQKSEPNEKLIFDDERVRLRFSLQLRTGLVVSGVLLAFALIDSFAQTIYGATLLAQFRPSLWVTATFGPLIALGGLGRTLVSASSSKPDDKRFKIPATLLAGAAAFVIVALLLVTIDAISYVIAWKNTMPLGPRPAWTTSQRLNDAQRIEVRPLSTSESKQPPCGNQVLAPKNPSSEGWQITASSLPPVRLHCGSRNSKADLFPALVVLGITFLFSFLFGWSWPFLNRSTHQSIYTSRLIRAYLGASNPTRFKEGGSVTQTIINDDINQDEYWPRFKLLRDAPLDASGDKFFEQIQSTEQTLLSKGMPLHLVNVTINETLDPKSKIEQRDRKGTSMAIGPAGISVGVHDHLVLGADLESSPSRDSLNKNSSVRVYPSEAGSGRDYRVFRYIASPKKKRVDFGGEFLTLGNWTGISGAAFSTSLGWRTSLPLSLVAGLANVRLTYWWNSGVKAIRGGLRENWWRQAASIAFEGLFSVQKSFFDELLARYRGTARQWWPLSDGGHFENLGGYELIRRRLPAIVIIDAEADPDYTFEGLANLVRKARLDFGAEIKFLSEDELDKNLHPDVRSEFGTLEQLRRGVYTQQPTIRSQQNGRQKDSAAGYGGALRVDAVSQAHAALAVITYLDNATTSTLVYIKPSLVGDEPADVHRYHTEHPSFPHESTLQQFFDEAQWESYRKLGEHIAINIFKEPMLKSGQSNKLLPSFSPYSLLMGIEKFGLHAVSASHPEVMKGHELRKGCRILIALKRFRWFLT